MDLDACELLDENGENCDGVFVEVLHFELSETDYAIAFWSWQDVWSGQRELTFVLATSHSDHIFTITTEMRVIRCNFNVLSALWVRSLNMNSRPCWTIIKNVLNFIFKEATITFFNENWSLSVQNRKLEINRFICPIIPFIVSNFLMIDRVFRWHSRLQFLDLHSTWRHLNRERNLLDIVVVSSVNSYHEITYRRLFTSIFFLLFIVVNFLCSDLKFHRYRCWRLRNIMHSIIWPCFTSHWHIQLRINSSLRCELNVYCTIRALRIV